MGVRCQVLTADVGLYLHYSADARLRTGAPHQTYSYQGTGSLERVLRQKVAAERVAGHREIRGGRRTAQGKTATRSDGRKKART